MKRRQKRKIVLIALLVLALAALGMWYWNFRVTKSVAIDLTVKPQDVVTAPKYLYSFAGSGANHLKSPVGVLADGGLVYVTDSRAGLVFVFRQDGTFVRTFGKGHLTDPLYIAKNPKDGLLYVADRRERQLVKFKASGEFVGNFDPNLPKSEQASFDTHGVKWIPIAFGFAPDGTMYVMEMLDGQRMLIFGPDGTFKKSVGKTGIAAKVNDEPAGFQFPNSVKVHGDEVWVVDSNNRRLQVFSLDGTFKRIVGVSGLPRGMAFLPKATANTSSGADVYAVVDVLTADVSLWTVNGSTPVTFGERGVGDGQFSFPNDISVGDRSIIFVTDNKNVRVQAWGWANKVSPIPQVLPEQPAWCLALLPLLLLPLLRRKKRFFATADFVEAMLEAGNVHTMAGKRRQWLVLESDYEKLRDKSEGDILLSELLEPTEYSDTDARALQERLEVDAEQGAILAAAQRVKLFATDSAELRRLARILEIDVVGVAEYLARFGPKN